MVTNNPSTTYFHEVRERCDHATPGPWVAFIEGRDFLGGDSMIQRGFEGNEEDLYLSGATVADFDFIAHARQDIPILLDEIERLQKILVGA